MKKVYFLAIAIISLSFKTFDSNYFALTVNFTQDWSNPNLITANDNWSGVTSIEGYLGQDITTGTGVNPQTLLTTSSVANDLDDIANQSNPNTNASGGVAEFDGISNPTIALQGSGTADAPYIIMYLNTTGATNIRVQYNLRDIDGSADNAVQPVALQYRVGATGNFTNIAAGFVADATTGPNLATLVTAVNVILPAACENQSQVQLRIMTANAAGSDEWVGIDDIVVTPNSPVNNVSVSGGGNISEAGPNGTFTLTFNPVTSAATTVDYDLSASSATLTTDYSITLSAGTPSPLTPLTGTITVPSGTSSVTMTVAPVNDANQELTETVALSISNPSGTYTLGASSVSSNIIDDDFDPISYTGATYTQDFNTLANSGGSSTTPVGWLIAESGSGANGSYVAGTGSSNAGDTYSFGTGTNTDRAFGGLRSGALTPLIGGKFINNTGSTVNSLTISYTGEQWRSGAAGRVDKLDFQYSLDATNLSSGTWTDVDALDFTSLNNTGGGALDGNATANRTTTTFTINGLSIPAGSLFFFRWLDFDASGADDGLGIDDFSLSPGCTPPTNQPTGLLLTPALTSISGSFTAATAGTTPADAYLVVMSTSASLGASPSSGTAYAIDDAIGNGQVVSIGNSLTFNVAGLTPSTPYYFFVFSNSTATNCYNITSPLSGTTTTLSPPACTAPSPQVSVLTASNITGTSIDLNYTRGGGSNILIVARTGSPVNSNPINSLSYPAGTQIGTGNFVIFNGTANTFSYTGLTPNTTYYFALYEYNSADLCYNASALTGNFNTACTNPINVSALNSTSGNTTVNVSWTLPNASCYDEIIVVASNASVPGTGGDYTAPANSTYAGPNQVVYRGVGTSVAVTGLTNGTTYFFKVFTRLGTIYSSGVQTSGTAFDPASGYLYMYGNLHAHSSYSDGNKDNTAKIPTDDYVFARDALCMDFLGISEHNHAGAGMTLSNFPLGYAQANALNGVAGGVNGNSIVTLWGMEWGVISGGGHVVTYGFDDQLVGWEPGNYNILVAKNDYTSLFNLINGQAGAFATLAHPNNTDYDTIAGHPYSAIKDNAIVGVAVESGPAFSTHATFPYTDYPAQLSYLSYYKTMLAKGYHLGATMDQDNHNMTFGTANANRLVVLTTAKTRSEIMSAMRNMRFYASEDCNARVDFKLNSAVIGSTTTGGGVPSITLTVSDPDAEDASTIELWRGVSGGSVPSAPIKTYTDVNTFSFNSGNPENNQPDLSTYYYFLIITQTDGNKIVTSPIWYSRNDIVLPVTLMDFTAVYNSIDNSVLLNWSTAQEFESKTFAVQRSNDGGITYTTIGTVAAGGTTTNIRRYQFTDFHPQNGKNLYRLKEININDTFDYSRIISISTNKNNEAAYFSIYPNPVTNGYTYLYSTSVIASSRASIKLIDLSGKVISTTQATFIGNAPFKYDLKNIKPGMYVVKIIADETVTNQKILVR